MNTFDYLQEMNQQLKVTFTNKDGSISHFYEKTNNKTLDKQTKLIINLIEEGVQRNLISKSDRKILQPSGNPNRLYGLPKVHNPITHGDTIPPCRPTVSISGSNTEMISALIDYYSKHLVKLKILCSELPTFSKIKRQSESERTTIEKHLPIHNGCYGIIHVNTSLWRIRRNSNFSISTRSSFIRRERYYANWFSYKMSRYRVKRQHFHFQ